MSIYFYLWITINTLHLSLDLPLLWHESDRIISIHICQYLYANPIAPPYG
jgi:hypothetical protein